MLQTEDKVKLLINNNVVEGIIKEFNEDGTIRVLIDGEVYRVYRECIIQ